MIEFIENSIINVLKQEFSQSQIDSFPTNFEDYNFFSHDSCILIRFEDSDIDAQKSITRVNSMEKYNFTLFISKRYAAKHSDCYEFLSKIKKVLNGLSIMSKRLILTKRKFEEEINGDLWWSYNLSISLPIIDEHRDLSPANNVIAGAGAANSSSFPQNILHIVE